jgi:hypothetical protein
MTTYAPLVQIAGEVHRLDAADALAISTIDVATLLLTGNMQINGTAITVNGSSITSNLISNWNTAYGWGNHAGLYDPINEASGIMSNHESTYNHTHYNTAYSWGDHSGLYDLLGTAASAVTTHESTYNHNSFGLSIGAPTTANQIYQATGNGTGAWTTNIVGLTSLTVDNITIDGSKITGLGTIDFDDENLWTLGWIKVGNWTIPNGSAPANSLLITATANTPAWQASSANTLLTANATGIIQWSSQPWNFSDPGPTTDNQILQATGAGTAAWTTDVQTLTSLQVDNLTIDGSGITSTGDLYLTVAVGSNIHFDGSGLLKIRDLSDGSNIRIQVNLTNTRTQFYGPDEVEYVIIEPYSGGQVWSKVPVRITANNVAATYGTANNASVYYDGTNFVIDPDTVGSGNLVVGGNETVNGVLKTAGTHVSVRRHVFDYYQNSATLIGTMKIRLPFGFDNIHHTIRIRGYQYTSGDNDGAWECTLGGYPYSTMTWYAMGGFESKAPFTTVRAAHDGTDCCYLLGTESTVWSYPHIEIEISYHPSRDSVFNGSWNIAFSSNEAGDWSLTSVADVPMYHASGTIIPRCTADNQILQATATGIAAWTTDVQTLTSLQVDDLAINGQSIISAGALYLYSDTANIILRAQTSGGVYIDTSSKFWVRTEGSYTTRFTVNAVDGSVGIGSDNLSNTGAYMNVWTTGTGIASQFLVTGQAYSSDSGAYSMRVATQAYPANGQQARQINIEGSVKVDTGNTVSWLIGEMINPITKSGNGTITNAASLYVYPQTVGATNYAIIVTGGVSRFNDSAVLSFGSSSDATITYDGSDLIVDPDAIGSGHLKINGATDIVGGLTVDGISVSGTLQIGSSDVCRVLSENKTYYVRTTGNDTTGDGSSGTPWLTVSRALDEIYKWVADENTITIDVGEGTFNESTLSPTYAYGSNLYVVGVSETHNAGCAVSAIGSITALESGLEYIDFTITLPVGYTSATGQYIICKTASGGTNEHLTLGVHEVVGWDSGNRAATVRCVRRAGVTAVPSGAISLTDIRVIKTVLSFSSGHGVSMTGAYHGGNWNSLVLKGNASGYALNLLSGASFSADTSFGTSNWNYTIYCAGNGNFFGDSTCHSFCRGSLVRVQNGGIAQLRYNAVLTGARTQGIFCFVGGTVAAYQVQMATCGNADGVLCYQGGFVDISSGYIRDGNPTGTGCNANRGGGIDATSATISGYTSSTSTATNGYIIGP